MTKTMGFIIIVCQCRIEGTCSDISGISFITMMASKLQIVSWNVRGLNNKFKRAKVFQNLKQVKPHVVLQETHLEGSKILSLRKPWIQKAFHSTYSAYARGVSILISKAIACTVQQVVTDRGGRYVAIVLEMYSQTILLVSIYLPPPF